MNLGNYFAYLFVMLSCILTFTNSEYRVVGGTNWNIESSPYLVAILFEERNHCVGSIVTEQMVVTAANCVAYFDVDLFIVVAGVRDLRDMWEHGQVRNVQRAFWPCDYNAATNHMDIALMKVREVFVLCQTVQTIKMFGCSFQRCNKKMRVYGWGWTTAENGRTSDILQSTLLTSLLHSDCADRYKSAKRIFTKSMICAAHDTADVCVGDSGAPGVIGGKLCAVVSYNLGCMKPDYPSVFTVVDNKDVKAFLDLAIKY